MELCGDGLPCRGRAEKMKLTLKGAQKKLTKLIAEKVIERDKSTCQYCGKIVDGSNRHISHVIPKSMGNRLRWDLINLKVLCFHHHLHFWHKNSVEAGEWFQKKFPERWAYLLKHKNETVKWKIDGYIKMIEELKV